MAAEPYGFSGVYAAKVTYFQFISKILQYGFNDNVPNPKPPTRAVPHGIRRHTPGWALLGQHEGGRHAHVRPALRHRLRAEGPVAGRALLALLEEDGQAALVRARQ